MEGGCSNFPDSGSLRVSSVFAGVSTECQMAEVFIGAMKVERGVECKLVHTASFEIFGRAHRTLIATTSGPMIGNICNILPLNVRRWATAHAQSFLELKSCILIGQVELRKHLLCHRSGRFKTNDLGTISFAGIPCINLFTHGP